ALASFVVDFAHVRNVQKELQAAADASALAAVQDLPTGSLGTVQNTAIQYSANPSGPTGLNARPTEIPSVTTTVTLHCYTLGTFPCPASTPTHMNGVLVNESSNVHLKFLGGLNVPGVSVGTHASSAAVMSGGFPPPLDVMILIDRTGSMGSSCTAGGT